MQHTPCLPSPERKTSVHSLPYLAANDIKAVLGSVHVKVSDEELNRVIASLKGKDVNKLIAEGTAKIGGSDHGHSHASKPAKEEKKK